MYTQPVDYAVQEVTMSLYDQVSLFDFFKSIRQSGK